MKALEKKEGERRRREKAVGSKFWFSEPQRGRTQAHLAERGGFWVDAVVAAGLFGNSPVSGALGPVTRGRESSLKDLQTRAPPNIVLN